MFVKHIEFRKNDFSYQPSYKISISCVFCENVYIDQSYSYKYNHTCSYDCYVKYISVPCSVCQNNTGFSRRCSSCYTLMKQKLEKYSSEEIGKLASKYEKKKGKDYMISKVLQLIHSLL